MKQRFLYFRCLFFYFPILLLSCENEVDFEGKKTNPKMVVNAIIEANGEQQRLKLSESVFIFGDEKPKPMEDAELILFVNGKEKILAFEKMEDSHRYYRFHAGLVPGDEVEVSGSSPFHDEIRGIDHTPKPVVISGVKTEWFMGMVDNRSYLRLLISFKDIPGEKNYYRIVIRGKDYYEENGNYEPNWIQETVYVDQEPVFKQIPNTPWSEDASLCYCIFSDELIDGKDYTLNVYIQKEKINFWGSNPRSYLKVEMHALSENLYRYLHSLELAGGEDHFSEPVKIYSNIKGGYGILGIYNITDKVIEVVR